MLASTPASILNHKTAKNGIPSDSAKIGSALSFLFVIDGLFFLFPNAGKCEHFRGYMANKCAGQEIFIGIHDLPIMIYFGVLIGVPALAALSRGIWMLIAGESDAKNSVGG